MLVPRVSSARMPVNMELLRKTSRSTSFEIFSTLPGFDRPNFALRSEKESHASAIMEASWLLVKGDRIDPVEGASCANTSAGAAMVPGLVGDDADN